MTGRSTLSLDQVAVTAVKESPPDQVATAYEAVRFNALKHGILSRYTVLSHESQADYESLVQSLLAEHLPVGATEQHLVEELASVIWRKRRVLQAEGAAINRGLQSSAGRSKSIVPAAAPFALGLAADGTDVRDLMDLSEEDVAAGRLAARHDLELTVQASSILAKGGRRAYERARATLPQDSRDWWDTCRAQAMYPADESGLKQFIMEKLDPFCRQQVQRASHHDAIVNQALGEGLRPDKLENLARYESHLDRKFERVLGMLVKLRDLRAVRVT